MSRRRRLQKSRFNKGDLVILLNEYEGVNAGHIYVVDDPYKYGKLYKIKVVETNGQNNGKMIPSKYLKKIK